MCLYYVLDIYRACEDTENDDELDKEDMEEEDDDCKVYAWLPFSFED